MAPADRKTALRFIRSLQKRARPGTEIDYLDKLTDADVLWLADFESAGAGYVDAQERLNIPQHMRDEIGRERYKAAEASRNRHKMLSFGEVMIEVLADNYQGLCPWMPGKEREKVR